MAVQPAGEGARNRSETSGAALSIYRSPSITAGASGVIFGWLTYLLVRGIFSGRPGQIAIAVVVFLLYGSVLWGVFPTAPGVSWQAHLGGAIGSVVAAWQLHRRPDQQRA